MSSTPKEIIFEEAAREQLLAGITKLADLIAFTLGPKGRYVGLEKSWGAPSITNHGSNIVKEITLSDQYQNMGVSMAKEVVQKVKEKCGDGTTMSVLILKALCEAGIKLIAGGASPISIKRGMEKALDLALKEIKKNAIPVKSQKEIENIATASSSGNQEIGMMIAQAMEKVGKNGVTTIEEAKGTETTIEMVEGMQFDRGYISAYFCTNSERMTVELNQNPQILLLDKKISNVHEILPILSTIATAGRELLIIAEDVEADALSTLVVNKLRGTLKVAAIKAPGFGDRRKAMLEDIGILTGATVVSEESGVSLKEISDSLLGSAEKIIISKDHTVIINGIGTQKAIQARIKLIESEIATCKSSYEKEKLEERKAKLSGGVAVIRVGAPTESELKQKKQIFEDSLNSTKAAVEEGVVTGGCVALLHAGAAISSLKLEGDEALGAKMLKQACETPFKQIVANAGLDGSVLLAQVRECGPHFGFNALTNTIEDLMAAGIVDPAKVLINVLMHAVSAAGIVILSEALIGEAPEEETE
jgi:chaperonin GroEL